MDKKWLKDYKWHQVELDMLDELIKRLESRIEQPGKPQLSHVPKRKGGSSDKLGDDLGQLQRLREKYNGKWDVLISERIEFEQGLDILEATERVLMRLRYEKGLGWNRVAKRMGYERAQVFRIHDSALKKMRLNDTL